MCLALSSTIHQLSLSSVLLLSQTDRQTDRHYQASESKTAAFSLIQVTTSHQSAAAAAVPFWIARRRQKLLLGKATRELLLKPPEDYTNTPGWSAANTARKRGQERTPQREEGEAHHHQHQHLHITVCPSSFFHPLCNDPRFAFHKPI